MPVFGYALTFGLGAIVGVALCQFVRCRWPRDEGQMFEIAKEAHIEQIEVLQESVVWLRIEYDQVYHELQHCRSLRKLYENILREEQIDYAERLTRYLEEAG